MPVIYDDANKRRRYDAFKAMDEAKVNPLSEAIRCAVEIENDIEKIEKAIGDRGVKGQTRAQLVAMLPKLRSAAFYAWKEISEFVYAKPKAEHFDPEMADALQKIANKTQMLEVIMKLNYPEKQPAPSKSNGNGNGAGH